MITTVARIVTRLQGEGDGLFVGALFKNGRKHFKPNTIYEIRDIMGVLTIVEVGRATGAGPDNCISTKLHDKGTQFSWCSNIGSVIDHGESIFLTSDEYSEMQTED